LSGRARKHLGFAALFSSALISQAVLSAASFAVGLILIRGTTTAQYGYYVLALNALLLLGSVHNALFSPSLAIRINRLDRRARGEFVGRLYREQRRLLPALGVVAIIAAFVLWAAGVVDPVIGSLMVATAATSLALLHRDFFRIVLLALRRAGDVLRNDLFYAVLLVVGVLLATHTPYPAAGAIVAGGIAGFCSRIGLGRALRRHEPWDSGVAPGLLREIAPLAAWTTAGASIQWAFSQGYMYFVAGTLDVAAVAALAATRLLLMPVNLLSAGIGSLMLPLAAGWLDRHGLACLRRRLWLLGAGVALATVAYFVPLWFARDWIFATVFRKHFEHRDALLLLWAAVVFVMVVRVQLGYLLEAQGRFRALTLLTLASSIVALGAGYAAMQHFGVTGALLGMLCGEVTAAIGIVTLSAGKAVPAAQPAQPAQQS
jgi:O-antigen/teichoic acid export membrane protein